MSLNFSKIGDTVATVIGGTLDKNTLYIDKDNTDTNNDYVKSFTKIYLPQVSKFQQVPRSDFKRECYYVTGGSGSGKSYYTEKLIEQIRKIHKDYPIYIFSPLEDNYNNFKNVKRVILDESLVTDPISYEELINSIVVFDDIEAVTDKRIFNSLMKTLNQILFIGRHENIYCFFITHESCRGQQTKPILGETNSITCFPRNFDRNMEYLMQAYFGLSKNEIAFVRSHKSRFCTYYKQAPNYLIFENEIYTKNEFYDLANEYVRKRNVERKSLEKHEMRLKLDELEGGSKIETTKKKTNKK